MKKKSWTITEVIETFQVEPKFLDDLEKEDIVCPEFCGHKQIKEFTAYELEKLRVAKLLVEEFGVNLPGVDIILRMRLNIFEMRNQFDVILADMAKQMHKTFVEDREKHIL
ncbi:chaperone modulator CbpM [candidate division CSSED10-310 bacterium]|uniref:Chaperone modulator CbpM n=1 Tax=candidate division CSSED10-310 bacterium TaxID=2855610 RepID=A0ABV6YYQ8_UNCC1